MAHTTNRILDVLQEQRPRVICIDELDKMSVNSINFLESGRIKVDKQRGSYDFEIRGAKVFATCNGNGYPDLCNCALDVCTCRLIQRSNS